MHNSTHIKKKCIYLVLNLAQIYNALPDIIWLLRKHNYGVMFLCSDRKSYRWEKYNRRMEHYNGDLW